MKRFTLPKGTGETFFPSLFLIHPMFEKVLGCSFFPFSSYLFPSKVHKGTGKPFFPSFLLTFFPTFKKVLETLFFSFFLFLQTSFFLCLCSLPFHPLPVVSLNLLRLNGKQMILIFAPRSSFSITCKSGICRVINP